MPQVGCMALPCLSGFQARPSDSILFRAGCSREISRSSSLGMAFIGHRFSRPRHESLDRIADNGNLAP